MQTWRVSGGSSSLGGDDFESQSDQNPDVSGRAVLKGLLGSLGAGGDSREMGRDVAGGRGAGPTAGGARPS